MKDSGLSRYFNYTTVFAFGYVSHTFFFYPKMLPFVSRDSSNVRIFWLTQQWQLGGALLDSDVRAKQPCWEGHTN